MAGRIDFTASLSHFLQSLSGEISEIPPERTERLEKLADFVLPGIKGKMPARLVFICTHNSRRSHFGQIWAYIISRWFGLDQVLTFSGGTEATAFNPNAVKAVEEAGVEVQKVSAGPNPVYRLFFAEKLEPIEVFSKKYDHPANPKSDFCAVMTCSDADINCPYIPGADFRISLTYDDPKTSDGTHSQEDTYRERSRQIAREMYYLFNVIKKKNSD